MKVGFNTRCLHDSRRVQTGAQPILFLHAQTCEESPLRALGSFTTHSVSAGDPRSLETWKELEEEFNSSSIGLIADASGAAFQILWEGFAGAPMPGAIVLLGWNAHDLNKLLDGQQKAVSALFEWPEVRVILDCNDPSLGLGARMVRKLRAWGVPIGLEVVSSMHEIAEELEWFFSANLTPVFPKMN